MITAVFNESDTARASGLWQYDYGQVLRIQGLSLPAVVEIDFSLQESGGESEPQIGLTKDGATDVMIPNSMLKNDGCIYDYNIYAFIYITDESSGKTIKKIIMRVKARPRIGDEKIDTPEDRKLFREAIEAVNKSAVDAKEAEKSAEGWAHGHEEYTDRDEDNAKYYAEQAKESAEHAEQVATKNGFAFMEIEEDGNLYLTRTTNIADTMNFELNENGELEVIING